MAGRDRSALWDVGLTNDSAVGPPPAWPAWLEPGIPWPATAALLAVLAYIVAVVPRGDFSYPVHVDEWTHLAYAEALAQHGWLQHPEPLYGVGAPGFRPETGFRVLLAELRLVTGMDWPSLFPALAGALHVLFVLTVLQLGRALGGGLWPGIVALGTPTTARFLGPALVVPAALSLSLLAALTLVLARSCRTSGWLTPILTGLLLSGIVLVHPPTAVVAGLLTVASAIYLARQRAPAERPGLWATAAVGAVLPFGWFLALPAVLRAELVMEAVVPVGEGQGLIMEYVRAAGLVRIALFASGAFCILAWSPRPPHLAMVAAYGLLLTYIRLHEWGLLPGANFYDRSWLYLDLTLTLVSGVGLAVLMRRWTAIGSPAWRAARLGPPLVAAALTAAVVGESWQVRAEEQGYRLASPQSAEDFRWIRDHLQRVRGLTLLDPRIAVTYPAQAARPVYASAAKPRPSPPGRIRRALELLQAPEPDVAELRREGIAIVYRPEWREAEGMREVRPGIYLVCPAEPPQSEGCHGR